MWPCLLFSFTGRPYPRPPQLHISPLHCLSTLILNPNPTPRTSFPQPHPIFIHLTICLSLEEQPEITPLVQSFSALQVMGIPDLIILEGLRKLGEVLDFEALGFYSHHERGLCGRTFGSTLARDLNLNHILPLTPRSQLCHPKPLGIMDPSPFLLMCPQGRRTPPPITSCGLFWCSLGK